MTSPVYNNEWESGPSYSNIPHTSQHRVPTAVGLGVRMESRSSLLFLLPVLVGLSLTPSLAQTQKPDVAASFRCPVTVPNSNEPPNSEPPSEFPAWVAERNREGDTLVMAGTGPMLTSFWDVERNREGDALLMAETRPMRTSFHGNGKLWTILPPRVGASVERVSLEKYGEQATAVQIDWWEMGRGLLVIKGTRLDGPAGPLRVEEWWRRPNSSRFTGQRPQQTSDATGLRTCGGWN